MNEPSDHAFPGGDPVQEAYHGLPLAEPSKEMDQAVLSYAKASTRNSSKGWVWPLSLAAGVLVTLGIVTQMAQIVPSGSYPRSEVAEVQRAEPREVAASGEFDQSNSMQQQTIEVQVAGRSAEAWVEQLRELAEHNKPQQFLHVLAEARQDYPDLVLPAPLSNWAAQASGASGSED